MGIADFFRPKHRHSNVRVRAEAVRALTDDDAAIILQVAKSDSDSGVRRIAIGKIHEADVLAELAAAEPEGSVRDYAGGRAAELWRHAACGADDEKAQAALGGIIKLGESRTLVDITAKAALPAIRKRAFGEIRDPRALADLAKSDATSELRLAAVERIDDADVLRALAIDTTHKEVGLAAVEKLDDAERLELVAQKAKNKAVRQRARKTASEMADAERAKQKQTVPDDVKRRRAERAQLVREVEAVADTFDFAKYAPVVTAAEAAWAAIGHTDDAGVAELEEKLTRAAQRFRKRREVHDQQVRSADELRAVADDAERQKQREREREAPAVRAPDAPEASASAPAPASAPAAAPAPDPREAEARARRAAMDAEREARRKEDAERGTAIAQSLAALCEDLEKLETKDARAIERALQQAGKAFEQIGKAPSEARDAIADRYTVARGKLVVRVSELREAEDWKRFQNVPKAEALIATAKEMSGEEPSQDLANRLRQLQALWKEVGPIPQRRSKELWDQFKAACDAVYDKVRVVRAAEGEKFSEVAKVKEALIAEAEALAESTELATAEKLKALQARWKDSGHVPRKQGDELWQRFRAACDRFFERVKPQLDARRAEETENLARKQALIERAQRIADAAPGEGGWGKAIGAIKDLQREWKEIGYVPRRDADAVYKAFRAACDALFAKRDASRDAEANAHRAELDGLCAEIAAIGAAPAGAAERVAKAIAVRGKVRELDARELSGAVEQMIGAVIASENVAGTELDPVQLRARRDKLIAKAEELLPKQAQAADAGTGAVNLAAQLTQAMRANAFGDLRFSGRDPVEVVDELRAQWADAGPWLDDADRAQAARFEATCARVLAAAGTPAKREERDDRGDRSDRGDRGDRGEGRRRRRDRHGAEQALTTDAPAAPLELAVAASGGAPKLSVHDVPTVPTSTPSYAPAKPVAPVAVAQVAAAEPRARRSTASLPPPEDLDTGWDLGDDDSSKAKPAEPTPPSSAEMAGDGATGGDGIDEPGWD